MRLVAFSALWLLLTGGDLGTPYVGALAVVSAAALSVYLLPAGSGWRWTPGGTLRFVPFFLWQSLSGGFDIALRALRPSLPLEPELVEYRFSLTDRTARLFITGTVGLLPGTLGARLEGDTMYVHSLVGERAAAEGAKELEVRVADLFGLDLPEPDGAGSGA